jgi:hypothetical protein
VLGGERVPVHLYPTALAGQARVGHHLRDAVGRHGQHQVEDLVAVLEVGDSLVGRHELALRGEADRALGQLLGDVLGAGAPGVRHEDRLERDRAQLDVVAYAALAEVLVEQHRALVGRWRARIWRTRDRDQDAPALERLDRAAQGRHAALVPDVVGVLGQARDQVGPLHRAQRDHQVVTFVAPAADERTARRRVDRLDTLADEVDAVALEREAVARALGDRADACDLPQLAQAHREAVARVDEDDIVLGRERPQLDGGRNAPEAAAEDECAGHSRRT